MTLELPWTLTGIPTQLWLKIHNWHIEDVPLPARRIQDIPSASEEIPTELTTGTQEFFYIFRLDGTVEKKPLSPLPSFNVLDQLLEAEIVILTRRTSAIGH